MISEGGGGELIGKGDHKAASEPAGPTKVDVAERSIWYLLY